MKSAQRLISNFFQFAASGGKLVHKVRNSGIGRLAIKVKTSSSDLYRTRPVYAFIEGGEDIQLEILRLTGPPRTDILVIQFAEVPQEETDPQGPFNAGAQQGECVIHLEAV
uniref:MSP domain-containing protein n=1 Tax=Ascaris lumbricoides TaxID=6252 RepID=A0A0M3HVJ0_ASCLU